MTKSIPEKAEIALEYPDKTIYLPGLVRAADDLDRRHGPAPVGHRLYAALSQMVRTPSPASRDRGRFSAE